MRSPDDLPIDFPAPAGPRLLVKVLDESERHYHGLFLPEGVMVRPDRGIVVAVGPGYRTHGGYLALDFDPGDEIVFYRERGHPIEIDGQELLILREDYVLVVLSPAPEREPLR